MDRNKFDNKIIKKVKLSLKDQKLSDKITPLVVVENRDRYFLIQCQNGSKNKKRLLFLRYHKWFFYIPGITKLPPDFQRRHYKDVCRTVLEKKPVRQRVTEEQINQSLDRETTKLRKEV